MFVQPASFALCGGGGAGGLILLVYLCLVCILAGKQSVSAAAVYCPRCVLGSVQWPAGLCMSMLGQGNTHDYRCIGDS
jgi:hypothetical protein